MDFLQLCRDESHLCEMAQHKAMKGFSLHNDTGLAQV